MYSAAKVCANMFHAGGAASRRSFLPTKFSASRASRLVSIGYNDPLTPTRQPDSRVNHVDRVPVLAENLSFIPGALMTLWKPDPTFYPSPRMAINAPPETLAYVAVVNPKKNGRPDALGVVDVERTSSGYGHLVGQLDMLNPGDELHHFGWNACSSCLCPYAPHPHMERRYLIVPGIASSRIHILDTKPDPKNPRVVKVIEPEVLAERTGYAAPHTVHCGPDGVYVSALGAPGGDGPGGTLVMDPETFEIKGKWEIDRGPQQLAYDVWWHLGLDTMVTSTWGTPNMVKDGVNPDLLLAGKYGNKLHFWDLRKRRHVDQLDLGSGQP